MNTLRQLAAEPATIPTRASWYLADLAEARGKQELFTRQTELGWQKSRMLLISAGRRRILRNEF